MSMAVSMRDPHSTPHSEALKRVHEEIAEVEYWLAGFQRQQAGVPRLRGLREAVRALVRTLQQEKQK